MYCFVWSLNTGMTVLSGLFTNQPPNPLLPTTCTCSYTFIDLRFLRISNTCYRYMLSFSRVCQYESSKVSFLAPCNKTCESHSRFYQHIPSHVWFCVFFNVSTQYYEEVLTLRFVYNSKFKGSENQHNSGVNVPMHIIIWL